MVFRYSIMLLSLRAWLKRLVETTDTRAGRFFDFFIQGMILISLISFSVDTLPDLPEHMRRVSYTIEVVSVLIFTVEYVLRLILADRRSKFIFSFYGIIDLLAILPFYLSVGIDLRSLRAVRLFRIFRLLKIFRYTKAIQRLSRALRLIQHELAVYLMITTLLMYLASVAIYHFEHDAQPDVYASVFHSMWWALVTLTTVGYGDVYPITVGGRIFTGFLMLIGVGVVAVPSGLMASALTQSVANDNEKGDE